MGENIDLAVIAGSGFYDMPGLIKEYEYDTETPFGKPSAPIVIGSLEGKRVAFLARHGIGHHITPGEVNYRANIFSLKLLGVQRVIGINACGSLREDYSPGHVVIPDQIFDHTKQRANSFFGRGLVAHASVAEPFCPRLSDAIAKAIRRTGITVHNGGSLIVIEGPRFSTKAESQIFRSWGLSIIGMTSAPEAFLAREAGLCYCTIAHVTDYDVWHSSENPVTVEMVVQILAANTQIIQNAIRLYLKDTTSLSDCSCASTMENAVITNISVIPDEVKKALSPLFYKKDTK